MKIKPQLVALHSEMARWRRDLHAHPELGFEEERTSRFVANSLRNWGIDVHQGMASTGVVGTLQGRHPGTRAIALRADMDALPMQEGNDFSYASSFPGKMHGCGHDGHTTMLLGAAHYLANNPDFSGIVHFIFQPAEEGRGGADRMLDEGLFVKFPCDAVYGLHNWPGIPLGTIGMRPGPMMASLDSVTIEVVGKGGHGGLPHLTVDPVVISAHIITALQTLVSRSIDPLEAAVVSITCINAGTSHNVIADRAQMIGTVRSLIPEVRDRLESGIKHISETVAQALGGSAKVTYERRFPAVDNSLRETDMAAQAAIAVVGVDNVVRDIAPVMGSEDFASMLQAKPGAYIFLGQAGPENTCMIHSPHYDFNDELLPIGASYWVSLVEQELGTRGDA